MRQTGGRVDTHGLAANVGMPDVGLEAHQGRAERVLGRDFNVDNETATLVRRARGACNTGFEMGQIAGLVGGLGRDVARRIGLYVGQLFGDSSGSARHVDRGELSLHKRSLS